MAERRFTKLYDDIIGAGRLWGLCSFFNRALVCHLIRQAEIQETSPEVRISIASVERWARVDRKIVRKHIRNLRSNLPNVLGNLTHEDGAKLTHSLGQISPSVGVNRPNKREDKRLENGRYAPSAKVKEVKETKSDETKEPSTLVPLTTKESLVDDQASPGKEDEPRPDSVIMTEGHRESPGQEATTDSGEVVNVNPVKLVKVYPGGLKEYRIDDMMAKFGEQTKTLADLVKEK